VDKPPNGSKNTTFVVGTEAKNVLRPPTTPVNFLATNENGGQRRLTGTEFAKKGLGYGDYEK